MNKMQKSVIKINLIQYRQKIALDINTCLLDEQTKIFKSLPELLQRPGFNLDNRTNCIIQIS